MCPPQYVFKVPPMCPKLQKTEQLFSRVRHVSERVGVRHRLLGFREGSVLPRTMCLFCAAKWALLHFIYWDSLPDMEEFSDLNAKCASTLLAQHLLAAADRYALERLRLLCEVMLCENVAINTVATTLVLAEQHHCSQVKAVCLKFAALPENLRAVMQTDGFEYLKLSCPSILTELLKYVARAEEHSAISFAHAKEALDGSDANGRRVKPRI